LRDYRRIKYNDPAISDSIQIPAPIQADEVDELANLATSRLNIIPPVTLMTRTDAIRAQKVQFIEENIILKGIEQPWNSINMLKHALLADDRIKKGFLKRKRIVEELCDLQLLQENGLFKILNNTICFILAELQGPFKFRESILTRCIRQNVEPKPVNQYSKTYNNIYKDRERDSYRETYRNSFREALKESYVEEDKHGDSVSYSSSSKHYDDEDEDDPEYDKKGEVTHKRRGRGPGKKSILKRLEDETTKRGEDVEYLPSGDRKNLDKLKLLLDVVSTNPPLSQTHKRRRDEGENLLMTVKDENIEQQQYGHRQMTEQDFQNERQGISHLGEQLSRQYQMQKMMMQQQSHPGRMNQGMPPGMPPQAMPPHGLPPGMPPQAMPLHGMPPQAGYMGYPYSPYMYPPMMRQLMPYNGMNMPMGMPTNMPMHMQMGQPKVSSKYKIRPGYQVGAWCQPGCLVGLYEDGIGQPTIYAILLAVVSKSNTITESTFELTVSLNDEVTLLNVEANSLTLFADRDKNEYICLTPQCKIAIWDRQCPQSRIFGLALRNKTLFSEKGELLPDETDNVIGVRILIDNQIAATIVPNMLQPQNPSESMSSQPQMYNMNGPMYSSWR